MSLMSSSTDEPSKIIADANKDFITIDIEEEGGGNVDHLDYEDELKSERHLSAGIFPSLFDDTHNDLSENHHMDPERGL